VDQNLLSGPFAGQLAEIFKYQHIDRANTLLPGGKLLPVDGPCLVAGEVGAAGNQDLQASISLAQPIGASRLASQKALLRHWASPRARCDAHERGFGRCSLTR
jgi:hypothetical protein